MKWVRISVVRGYGAIPTRSSRPKHHPRELSRQLIEQIVAVRLEHGRSAEVVHHVLLERGVQVSLSSVKRTLDRALLTKKRSPWKRYHAPMERPTVAKPGDLVQVDTIHLAIDGKTTLYVFTLVDVFSRFAYARAYSRVTAANGLAFVKRAQTVAPFLFDCVQSDHGPEWSTHFTERVQMRHRHTRVRKPNDNAHIERFNRTIQEECLDKLKVDLSMINRALPTYLHYYNFERHHFGLNLKKPMQVVPSY
jgi:transposase InsO family protein